MQTPSLPAAMRRDVFELRLRLDWLRRDTRPLSERMWGLELELAGVTDCVGRKLGDHRSEITGLLQTHPVMSVKMSLERHMTLCTTDEPTHQLVDYDITLD